jgi:hypothetical protein
MQPRLQASAKSTREAASIQSGVRVPIAGPQQSVKLGEVHRLYDVGVKTNLLRSPPIRLLPVSGNRDQAG